MSLLIEDSRGCRVGYFETAHRVFTQIAYIQKKGTGGVKPGRVIEACLESVARLFHGLYVGVRQQQRHEVPGGIVNHAAAHIHRTIVIDIECRTLAVKRLGSFHEQQVGIGVGLQTFIVRTDVGIVDDTGRDKESSHRVVEVFYLAEHRLQISQSLLLVFGRQLQGAHTILLSRCLHAFIDKVVVRAVTQSIRIIDDCDQWCGGGLFLTRRRQNNCLAILGAGNE